MAATAWAWAGAAVVVGGGAGWALSRGLLAVADALARRSRAVLPQALIRFERRPGQCLLVLLGVLATLPLARLASGTRAALAHALGLGLIGCVAWAVVELGGVVDESLSSRHTLDVRDNLRARQLRTRIVVLRRLFAVAVGSVALGAMLLTFPGAKQLGTSLLASAGLAGLVAGIAATPVLSNLIAGVQIALTQPIRLEDVVIVENEWGWIEEITSTYVVVRIWDLRRMVLPLSYFIQQPFQNWTRQTANLLGAVHLFVDYTVPVQALREELHRVLQATDLWDGKVWTLQVTEATEHALQLRCLMSAPDSNVSWDLRCHVREQLIAFLQRNYPHSLPRARLEVAAPGREPQPEDRTGRPSL